MVLLTSLFTESVGENLVCDYSNVLILVSFALIYEVVIQSVAIQ